MGRPSQNLQLPIQKTKQTENFLAVREGKRLIYEVGFLCQITSFVCLFIAFASPYWIVSWPRVHSGFKRIGLWEACFAGMVLPFDENQKSYHGCWWILAPEYSKIRSWIMPSWFILTQVVVTVCFVAEGISLFIIFILWLKSGGLQKKSRKPNQKDPLTLLQTAVGITVVTAFTMMVIVVVFGTCFYTDRQWLPNPYFNYLSWSYGLAVVSCFFSIFTSIAHWVYVDIVRQESLEPPRQVALSGYLPPEARGSKTAVSSRSGTLDRSRGTMDRSFDKSFDSRV